MTTYAADGLTWTDASLWQQFDAGYEASPDTLALVEADGRCWSRAELHHTATAITQALQKSGIRAHDRIMLEGNKTAPTIAAALAISCVGAVVCPYTPDLGKAERQVLEERLGHIALISVSEAEAQPIPGAHGLRLSLRRRHEPRPLDEADTAAALIGFTSGTTGVPKGVMHSSAAMNYTVRACERVASLEANDSIIGVVPLGSAPGFTFTVHFSQALGHPLVIVDPWDALRALQMMEQYSCRWGICVPTHLVAMVECAKSGQWTSRSPLRALAVGGSSMTPDLLADAEQLLGIRALRMFGMSECMGHASTLPSDSLERRQHSDGTPFPGTRDEAFDPDLKMLPRGARGQAGVKGPSLFLKYCEGLGGQEYRLTEEGYFLTGDEIICGSDNYLKVVGRLKDQIIRGGYNIDPAEVEAALQRHPAIETAIVVSVPHARLGEQACAICRIRKGYPPLQLSGLTDHLAVIGLSKKKWPEHLVIVEEMIYTATGKLNKKLMQKAAISSLGLG
ncbi:class I adenylate-forming enzyme family protein [Paraburkholderia sp. BL10I2N1]|uniref:class I adenylate-forming enzyme family protein n=1 Tax=Paraburkholderia sp. BL10I2N1 TaxID=1938796 RepID=UPI001FB5954E|nr:class I adenylate-forming enzyme family protein [Paraburkholderia sp. BL10I2N1]